MKLANAVATADVRRVVLLSGTSAHLKAGSAMGVGMMEDRLDGLDIAELVYVRGTFFMDNLVKEGMGVAAQAKTGIYSLAFRPDIAMPMIASKDIGATVAEILLEEPFRQPRVRELLGPREYTMAEATQILGSAIGMSNLRYVQCSYEDARAGMLGQGASPSFADAVMETARSFNEGPPWAKEKRSAQNTTPTSLEQFAQDTIRKK